MVGNLKSPITQRILDSYESIVGSPDDANILFLHTVLAQVGLPYRQPPQGSTIYEKQVGYASMVVQSGHLMDPQSGKMVQQGLPFGSKPRLLMIDLCSQAVKKQSPKIEIANSMSAFMKELGLKVTGGKTGTIATFKEQMNRLVASHITLGMFYPHGGATTLPSVNPISQMDVWFPDDPSQKMLWQSEITLNYDFFQSLMNHAVPMDNRAIRSLQHSSRALDIYLWLVYRLPQLKRSTKISYSGLQSQFGDDKQDPKTFKRLFNTAMNQALVVYPEAKVDSVDGGIIIHPSRPVIGKKPSVQITKNP